MNGEKCTLLTEKEQEKKVVLVTGAARRIGAAIAQHFHRLGFDVILHHHHSGQEALALQSGLNQKRDNSALAISADLASLEAINRLHSQALTWQGRLDVLINNASTFYPSELDEVDLSHWQGLMDVNLRAPFFLSQVIAPHLRASRGSIINITDIHAAKPLAGYDVYCMSKAGLMMQTKALAKTLAPDVRVNAVAPGAILWPEGDNALDEKAKQGICHKTPLKRHGKPQDIAEACAFLANHHFITGEVIAVDGGRHLSTS